MNSSFNKVPMSFIGANVSGYHIPLYLTLVIVHVEYDGPLILIDITVNKLNCSYTTTDLNLNIWAVRHNPSVNHNNYSVQI